MTDLSKNYNYGEHVAQQTVTQWHMQSDNHIYLLCDYCTLQFPIGHFC